MVEAEIPFSSAVVSEDFEQILDGIATFQLHLLALMKHSAGHSLNLLSHPRAEEIWKNFEERAKKGSTMEVWKMVMDMIDGSE